MQYIVQKPIWKGTDLINIGIRETFLKSAIKKREPIEVVCGDKRAYIDPKTFMKTGKLIEKVFKFPDNPMRLWQNNVKFEKEQTEDEKLKADFLKYNL